MASSIKLSTLRSSGKSTQDIEKSGRINRRSSNSPDPTALPSSTSIPNNDVTSEAPRSSPESGEHVTGVVNYDDYEAGLPPKDRGSAAWKFLGAAFLVELVVWGIPLSYGVLLDYYSRNEMGKNATAATKTLLPLVGTVSSGIIYCTGPLVIWLINKKPLLREKLLFSGIVLCGIGTISSSWAKEAWQLVLSAGVLYGIGGSVLYYPAIDYLTEWFERKRGLANGIVVAGTSVGGLILPFIFDALLTNYGIATTWRATGIASTLILLALFHFVKPRHPPRVLEKQEEQRYQQQRQLENNSSNNNNNNNSNNDTSNAKLYYTRISFWCYMFANVCQAFGWFGPILYMPSFSSALNLTGANRSAALSALNASGVVSRIILGIVADSTSPNLIAIVTLTTSALSVFLLWGLASTSLAPLVIFGLVFGALAGGWSSLWMAKIRELSNNDRQVTITLYGMMSFSRGIGNVLVAPVGAALTSTSAANFSGAYGVEGGKYAGLVLFTGAMMGIAGINEAIVTGVKQTKSFMR